MPVPGSELKIKQLDLELNGGCNLACEMCPQAEGREKGFLKKLPLPLLEKILADASQYGVEVVSLHGSGEPTLNADMPEIVKKVKEHGFKCMSFTNGLKLDEKLARRLIDAGIDILRVSAIGFDRELYARWMSKDAFQLVRDNVRRFVAMNAELGGPTQLHLYHLITEIENKEAEIAAYRENWVDYTGAQAEIWLMHNWSGVYAGPYDRASMANAQVKRSCGRPFSPELQVRAGGLGGKRAAVVACCMVLGKDSQAVLGHLEDQSIRDVIEGPEFEALRAAHTEGRFDDIPYCRDCDQLYNFPSALAWSNIPGRQYGQSKVVADLDYRSFARTA